MSQLGFTLTAAFAGGAIGILLLRLLPTLRLQLAGLTLLAVTLPLVTVLVSGLVMFQMGNDLKILVVASGAATSVLICAISVTGSIGRHVDALRSSTARFAAGDLDARAAVRGPTELAELAQTFNEMAHSIGRLFDARRELVAAASHDLRTPIAAMEAMHEAIEDGLVEPEHYLPALREQAHALRLLVDGLFELARIDAGALRLELRDAAIAEVVGSCLRALEAEAVGRGIRLESAVDPSVTHVRCAPEQIQRVLANLLVNAIRHTKADGAIAIRAVPLEDEVRISVEDDGEGLSADVQQRMFDRFWRGDRARSSRANAGLGLTIAKGLVEAHGGRIWAENRPEGGARISFTLPAV